MSLRDDTIIRDERGRIVKGSPGLHRKQEQPTQDQPDPAPDVPDGTIDDDIIAAANSFGSAKTKVGRRAFFESLRDTRPVEFAALLSKALARKAEAQDNIASGAAGVTVVFATAPSGWSVSPDGKLIEAADAKADWEHKTGMQFTGEPPPSTPPSKPVLVQPRDDEDEDEPPPRVAKPTTAQLARMSGSELAAALSANEIMFGDDDDDNDEPQSA